MGSGCDGEGGGEWGVGGGGLRRLGGRGDFML